MLIYRSPKTGAWMMTRDGVSYFEWIDGKWEPHRSGEEAQVPQNMDCPR